MTRSMVLSLLSSLVLGAFAPAQLIQYCTVTAAGESCGPQLNITMTPLGLGGNYDLAMTATGLHPSSPGGIVWGSNPASIPLPGGGCLLLCDYVWGHYFQTDSAGQHTWGRSWPHWAIGYYYMQMGSLTVLPNNDLSVLSTNCKLVQCF